MNDMFSRLMNGFVKVGFFISLGITLILGFRVMEYSGGTGLAILGAGTLISIAVWGMLGTVSEIGINVAEINWRLKELKKKQTLN